ncbi:hypothetical protein U1Q18_040431, partial [Sarracenia purpurea var. burkii]
LDSEHEGDLFQASNKCAGAVRSKNDVISAIVNEVSSKDESEKVELISLGEAQPTRNLRNKEKVEEGVDDEGIRDGSGSESTEGEDESEDKVVSLEEEANGGGISKGGVSSDLAPVACKEEEDSAMCRDEKGICDTKDGQIDMSSPLLSAEASVPVGSVT